jgi:apolipoprotein D and lipocalin family protein
MNGSMKNSLQKLFSKIFVLSALPGLSGCATVSFPTVSKVDLTRFMGAWYVAAGRFTFLEKEVNNAIEIYSYDEKTGVITIDFSYRRGAPDGKERKIPQTGRVMEGSQNAHWLVSPLWPLKFDYLIVALADDYSWVAVGVPDQKYLWIMFRKKNPSREEVQVVVNELERKKYNVNDLVYVPQVW